MSLVYNFSKKSITLSQKFINSRMVAQSGALIGIGLVAALNIKRDKARVVQQNDAFLDAVISKK